MQEIEYKYIDGLAVSKYGTVVAKRCHWCYNIIKSKEGKEIMTGETWCSKDCKEEEHDWNYFYKLRYNRDRSRRLWREKHPNSKVAINRKEYFKDYSVKNRDKKREKTKVSMRKDRAKKLLNNMK